MKASSSTGSNGIEASQGELEHRDSSGGGGEIGAGDVQWMTAGNGIVHEEFHSKEFVRQGGILQMVQLWVNLCAEDKPEQFSPSETGLTQRPPRTQSELNS